MLHFNAVLSTDMLSDLETECKCQCLSHLATYREDLGICVDDVRGKLFYDHSTADDHK